MGYLINYKPEFNQFILQFRNQVLPELEFIQLFQFLKINLLDLKYTLI